MRCVFRGVKVQLVRRTGPRSSPWHIRSLLWPSSRPTPSSPPTPLILSSSSPPPLSSSGTTLALLSPPPHLLLPQTINNVIQTCIPRWWYASCFCRSMLRKRLIVSLCATSRSWSLLKAPLNPISNRQLYAHSVLRIAWTERISCSDNGVASASRLRITPGITARFGFFVGCTDPILSLRRFRLRLI